MTGLRDAKDGSLIQPFKYPRQGHNFKCATFKINGEIEEWRLYRYLSVREMPYTAANNIDT